MECLCACVCVHTYVCWGQLEREREGNYHYLGGIVLCLNGLRLRHKWEWEVGDILDPLVLWFCDWFSLPELQFHDWLEKLILRKRHTQNKLSQLDTKAEVLSQLAELVNIGTARNLEIVTWQIIKQVQWSQFIQDYVAILWLDQQ